MAARAGMGRVLQGDDEAMSDVEQYEVFDKADKMIGKVSVRMWNDTPPRYISFDGWLCEFDVDVKRYIAERFTG